MSDFLCLNEGTRVNVRLVLAQFFLFHFPNNSNYHDNCGFSQESNMNAHLNKQLN